MIYRLIKDELLSTLRDFPVVAITGARQTGKITLARSFEKELEAPSHYLDLKFPTAFFELLNCRFFD